MKFLNFTRFTAAVALASTVLTLNAGDKFEMIKYGDFNSWITRRITESWAIGGKDRDLYEIGPSNIIIGNKPYNGSSPWATSNVYAKVSGITKGSCAVLPGERNGSDKCAKLTSKMETVKVLGVINMDVMVAGSIFLGKMIEPVSSTKDPYKKMIMGIPYTHRPEALRFDYKIDMPAENTRIRSTGFGSKKTLQGRDKPVIFVMLQRRWEDPDGTVHAKRVASGSRKFTNGAKTWQNAQTLPLIYGDPTGKPGYDASTLALRNTKSTYYYTKNSKGNMVPILEEGWDDPNATPTHVIVMISAGSGEPFVASPGLNFYVDNVGFVL
ncbi:MAG: PCMD domain-containing protein [Muribaculaceae bacterium]|nr:PCMD domain-containing protein [Muribaculaceae bacterium]MCF0213603.1 PCMD domain-containing protein [Muribaculaceae bacterium]